MAEQGRSSVGKGREKENDTLSLTIYDACDFPGYIPIP